MKISKSKQELARIISENGGWRDGANWSVQHKTNGRVVFTKAEYKPEFDGFWGCFGAFYEGFCVGTALPNWHQTLLSRDEYFHLHPALNADGWIEHDGKHDPEISTSGLTIWCKWSDGLEQSHEANMVDWIDDSDVRVVAYRLHKPEQTKSEFCEPVARSIPEPEYKPSIEQLMQIHCDRAHALSEKKAELIVAERQESEALDALKAACKEAGFDISPIEKPQESQEPDLVITDWRDLRVGDVVEGRHYGRMVVGEVCEIDEECHDNRPFRIYEDGGNPWWVTSKEFKFIRRP